MRGFDTSILVRFLIGHPSATRRRWNENDGRGASRAQRQSLHASELRGVVRDQHQAKKARVAAMNRSLAPMRAPRFFRHVSVSSM
jgi:hypothetical protein